MSADHQASNETVIEPVIQCRTHQGNDQDLFSKGIRGQRSLLRRIRLIQRQLRDSLVSHGMQADQSPFQVNIIPFISRCTLDIIGLAGFSYDFNTMKDGDGESTDELATAFAKCNRTDSGYAMMQLLLAWIPPLRWVMFDQVTRAADRAQKTMRRIGRRLVEEKKRALGFVVEDERKSTNDGARVFSDSGSTKDLLSLMIKANMGFDIAPEQRMSDEEVMHQIPTFMVAGPYQLCF